MIQSKSFAAKNYPEFVMRFEKVLKDLSFEPTLAFAFVSVNLPIKDIISHFNEKDIKLFGASSCGELLFDDSHELISEDGAIFTFTNCNPKYFKSKVFNREKLSSFEFGATIGDYCREAYSNPSLIVAASGLSLDGQALVEGVQASAGKNTTMFGGLAGDNSKFEQTFTFDENGISDHGAVTIVFDADHMTVTGLATSGWIGLGADLKVTKSVGNIVYEVDEKPALEVYKKYLSVNDEDLPAIGIEYPLMIKRDDGSHALRAVLGIDKEKDSLLFAGSVPQGSTVTFSSSPGFDVVETTKNDLENFYETQAEADLFILFSCMARHLALGPLIAQEIKLAADRWKTPVLGFFTYGEIGTNKGTSCDFYNQTFTLLLLKEH